MMVHTSTRTPYKFSAMRECNVSTVTPQTPPPQHFFVPLESRVLWLLLLWHECWYRGSSVKPSVFAAASSAFARSFQSLSVHHRTGSFDARPRPFGREVSLAARGGLAVGPPPPPPPTTTTATATAAPSSRSLLSSVDGGCPSRPGSVCPLSSRISRMLSGIEFQSVGSMCCEYRSDTVLRCLALCRAVLCCWKGLRLKRTVGLETGWFRGSWNQAPGKERGLVPSGVSQPYGISWSRESGMPVEGFQNNTRRGAWTSVCTCVFVCVGPGNGSNKQWIVLGSIRSERSGSNYQQRHYQDHDSAVKGRRHDHDHQSIHPSIHPFLEGSIAPRKRSVGVTGPFSPRGTPRACSVLFCPGGSRDPAALPPLQTKEGRSSRRNYRTNAQPETGMRAQILYY